MMKCSCSIMVLLVTGLLTTVLHWRVCTRIVELLDGEDLCVPLARGRGSGVGQMPAADWYKQQQQDLQVIHQMGRGEAALLRSCSALDIRSDEDLSKALSYFSTRFSCTCRTFIVCFFTCTSIRGRRLAVFNVKYWIASHQKSPLLPFVLGSCGITCGRDVFSGVC